MEVIFIVDDTDTNLVKAKQALDGYYRILTMPSAEKMFNLLERITPDLILLDIEMPEMDGFAALKKLMQNRKTAQIPVIFLTAKTDVNIEVRGFEMGAVDFITKPFSKQVLLNRLASHLHISKLIIKRTKHVERLQNSIISVLADMVENRDKVTGGHIERSTAYVRMLLTEAISCGVYSDEIKSWDLNVVIPSAQLHDVGKIIISDLILNKPGELNAEEFAIIKTHAAEGERIIGKIIEQTEGDVFLSHAKLFAGYHHERWDGLGYPHGLKGENIPLQGRIMIIADIYDALTSNRPYKKAFSHEDSMKIIIENIGKQFDPKLVKMLLGIENNFKKISSK